MENILTAVLTVLALAAVWLVAEVAITVRKARPAVEEIRRVARDAAPVVAHVDELVEQAKPVVAHLDEVVEGARPGVARIDPVLEQTSIAIGALAGGLDRLDAILGDVSRISRTAGNATTAVGDAAETLASKARGLFARGRTAARASVPAASQAAPHEAATAEEPLYRAVSDRESGRPDVVCRDAGYFTYPDEADARAEDEADSSDRGPAR